MSGLGRWWQSRGKTIQAAIIAGVMGMMAAIIGGGFGLLDALVSRAPQEPAAASTGVSVSVDYMPDPSIWVSKLSPAEIGTPPGFSGSCGDRHRLSWMVSKGAIQGTQNYVKVTVVAKRESNVVIRGVELDVHRLAPPKPAYIYGLCAGADFVDARLLEVNLDARPPTAKFKDYRAEAGKSFGKAQPFFTFSVKPDRPEVLLLNALAENGSYAWTARLLLTVDGRDEEQAVDDHGQPFKVTARPTGHAYLSKDPSGTPFVPGDV
jgi:hypothetical protein